jgi:hypothetical protein
MYGATQIPFDSWGRGPVVVLFCSPEQRLRLAIAMAERFRIIAPGVSDELGEQGLAQVLSVLVEGLGLVRPAAVLVGRFSELVAAAYGEPERLGQIEVLPGVPDADQLATVIEQLCIK